MEQDLKSPRSDAAGGEGGGGLGHGNYAPLTQVLSYGENIPLKTQGGRGEKGGHWI